MVNTRRKHRQIVVRLDASDERELENAQARLGVGYGPIVRLALRNFLRSVSVEDIRAELDKDERLRNNRLRRRARQLREELRDG